MDVESIRKHYRFNICVVYYVFGAFRPFRLSSVSIENSNEILLKILDYHLLGYRSHRPIAPVGLE